MASWLSNIAGFVSKMFSPSTVASALGSIASSGINAYYNSKSLAKQQQYNERNMALQQGYNEQNMATQQAYNLSNMEKQSELANLAWNRQFQAMNARQDQLNASSAQTQLASLRSAGLNPAMANGAIFSGNVATPSASAPSGGSPSASAPSGGMPSGPSPLLSISDLGSMMIQDKLADASISLTKSQKENQDLENEVLRQKMNAAKTTPSYSELTVDQSRQVSESYSSYVDECRSAGTEPMSEEDYYQIMGYVFVSSDYGSFLFNQEKHNDQAVSIANEYLAGQSARDDRQFGLDEKTVEQASRSLDIRVDELNATIMSIRNQFVLGMMANRIAEEGNAINRSRLEHDKKVWSDQFNKNIAELIVHYRDHGLTSSEVGQVLNWIKNGASEPEPMFMHTLSNTGWLWNSLLRPLGSALPAIGNLIR